MVGMSFTKKQFYTLVTILRKAKKEYEGHVKYNEDNNLNASEYTEDLDDITDLLDAVMNDDE